MLLRRIVIRRALAPLFLAFATLAYGADSVVRSGPFEVYSEAGDREAKDVMNFAEQLRYTLGWQLGNSDLKPIWPVRILVVKKKQPESPDCKLARDAYVCAITAPGPAFAASLTRILLDAWNGYLPPPLYRGLIQVYSTVDIEGPKITLGSVPQQKDRDWARAHMLSVDPRYSGKLRVLLGNLSKGVETDVAYRNAFAESPEAIERSLDQYLTAGNYGTITAPSRPLNAQRQLIAKDAVAQDINTLRADLLFAAGQIDRARQGYEAVQNHEGLGLIALLRKDTETAKKELAQATSARGFVEYSKLLTDPDAKRDALTKAANANKNWAEPHVLLAALESHPAQRLAELKKAVALEPAKPELWTELARLQEANKQFADAAKSWAAAERATGDPEQRQRVRQARMDEEEKRRQAEQEARAAERRRADAELEAFRNQALLKIRQAEAKANEGRPQLDASKLDEYKETPDAKKLTGTLVRVNCQNGSRAELVIATADKKTKSIVISDPDKVSIAGGGERSFTCGVQRPPRQVAIELGSKGEALSIEFK